MKRRLTLVLAVVFAVVLMGSLAWAAEKEEQAKTDERRPVSVSDEEALQAELLDTVESIRQKSADSGSGKKDVAEVAKVQIIDKRPEK